MTVPTESGKIEEPTRKVAIQIGGTLWTILVVLAIIALLIYIF